MISKRTVAALVLGAFLLAGAAAPFIVSAAEEHKSRPAVEKRQFSPAQAAERLAETYGVSKETVLNQFTSGVKFRDIHRAAFLAKASDRPLDEVLALKKSDNTWKDVAQTLGVTREKAKATRHTLVADRLNAKLGFDRATTLDLLGQGYKPRDITVAGLLAENTGKAPADVLALKKINNTWRDVAGTLGVSDETFKQDMTKLRQAFPRHGRGHGHHK